MGLISNAVALADRITQSLGLQALVNHRSFLSTDGAGKVQFVNPNGVSRRAVITRKQKMVKTASGELIMSTSQIVLLDSAVVVNEFDVFTLPDGTTGPVLTTDGYIPADTSHPVLTQVYLG
jgi:hypothetical protein